MSRAIEFPRSTTTFWFKIDSNGKVAATEGEPEVDGLRRDEVRGYAEEVTCSGHWPLQSREGEPGPVLPCAHVDGSRRECNFGVVRTVVAAVQTFPKKGLAPVRAVFDHLAACKLQLEFGVGGNVQCQISVRV